MKTHKHFLSCLAQFFLMRNVSDKSCRGNQNTCIMFNNFFLIVPFIT